MEIKKRVKLFKKYFKKRQGTADEKVYALIKADYEGILDRAKTLLHLQENDIKAGPVLITVPNAFFEDQKVRFRRDKKDGKETLVFDQALTTAVFFGEKTLYYYQANTDHRTGFITSDVAGSVGYFDIVHMQVNLGYDDSVTPNVSKLVVVLGISDGSELELKLRHHFITRQFVEKTLLSEDESKIIETLSQVIHQSR